jgi:SAM-dependent methyltransferase
MSTEDKVASHYTHGSLERVILEALQASGRDIDHLHPRDLMGSDEFHLGWHEATMELARDLALRDGMHILDIGSGLGGPARTFATACRCRVDGIDLTPELVAVANALTMRCGLSDRASFRQASALALPFDSESFDAATVIHVGMNIKDKAKLFGEVRRVLRHGARFGVYDVMRVRRGEIRFPMPWAATRETSFVETPDTYRRLAADAGFLVEAEHDRSSLALRLSREMRDRAEKSGPPLLGPNAIMGPTGRERVGNLMTAVQAGLLAPIAVICRAQ